jgi:hypothetical protein
MSRIVMMGNLDPHICDHQDEVMKDRYFLGSHRLHLGKLQSTFLYQMAKPGPTICGHQPVTSAQPVNA